MVVGTLCGVLIALNDAETRLAFVAAAAAAVISSEQSCIMESLQQNTNIYRQASFDIDMSWPCEQHFASIADTVQGLGETAH